MKIDKLTLVIEKSLGNHWLTVVKNTVIDTYVMSRKNVPYDFFNMHRTSPSHRQSHFLDLLRIQNQNLN